MKKSLLTIGGFDPTAGAGICLDLKVFQHMDYIGTAVLTAVTVQNTQNVTRIHCLPPDMIWEQYKTLVDDISPCGIKISMFGCKENADPVLSILSERKDAPVVVDPILHASAGALLSPLDTLIGFLSQAKEKISLVIPNCHEAAALSDRSIQSIKDAKQAAQMLSERFMSPFLIKGFPGKSHVSDILYDGHKFFVYKNKKTEKGVHGTGCFLSSSLLGFLVQKKSLDDACQHAIEMTQTAIQNAIKLGRGQDLIILP